MSVVALSQGLAWKLGPAGHEQWIGDNDTWFEHLHVFYFPSIH